jgi:hypothetical protein
LKFESRIFNSENSNPLFSNLGIQIHYFQTLKFKSTIFNFENPNPLFSNQKIKPKKSNPKFPELL